MTLKIILQLNIIWIFSVSTDRESVHNVTRRNWACAFFSFACWEGIIKICVKAQRDVDRLRSELHRRLKLFLVHFFFHGQKGMVLLLGVDEKSNKSAHAFDSLEIEAYKINSKNLLYARNSLYGEILHAKGSRDIERVGFSERCSQIPALDHLHETANFQPSLSLTTLSNLACVKMYVILEFSVTTRMNAPSQSGGQH